MTKVKQLEMGIPAPDVPNYISPSLQFLSFSEMKRLTVRGPAFIQVVSQFLRQEVATGTSPGPRSATATATQATQEAEAGVAGVLVGASQCINTTQQPSLVVDNARPTVW